MWTRFAVLTLAASMASAAMMGGYFANWANYHTGSYSYDASKLQPIVSKMSRVMYSFAYLCPETTGDVPYWAATYCSGLQPYQLVSVEPKDAQYIPAIVGYKSSNSNLKVVLSIGGWNFPSAIFSSMAASSAHRATFIASCKQWMSQYSLDGIDIDWEYPCSEARDDYVEWSCTDWKTVHDAGGKCPQDADNLLQLVKEMRASFGTSKIISIAAVADIDRAKTFHIKEMDQYIDTWNLMTYDYTVSDIADSKYTAPNAPLYAPPSLPGVPSWNVDYTVQGYRGLGIAPSKMQVGVALYGHTWYVPNAGSNWPSFGQSAQIQGQCCGPFQQTYGAKYGQGCNMCGTYMLSEIRAAGCQTYFDQTTKSDIMYCSSAGKDGYTAQGVWISYTDVDSVKAIAQYCKAQGLQGAFVFDTSMDTMSGGSMTYEVMNALYANL